MEIRVETNDDATVIAPVGSVNTNTAPEFEAVVEGAFADGQAPATLVFNFADLEYISSAGLRVLMMAYKQATAAGSAISVENASDDVEEVLEITGFAELFES